MGLDEQSRDYLYGRLLAVADNIERRVLDVNNEKKGYKCRTVNAAICYTLLLKH